MFKYMNRVDCTIETHFAYSLCITLSPPVIRFNPHSLLAAYFQVNYPLQYAKKMGQRIVL